MPESVVRQELEILDIHVQGVKQMRSGRRDEDPTKDRPPTHTSLYQWRQGVRCPGCAQSPNSAARECRWSRTWLQRALCNASAASDSDTGSETAVTRLGGSRVGSHLSGGCSTLRKQPQCCGCGGKHTANYRDCAKWKEAKAARAKQAPLRAHRNAGTSQPAAPKLSRPSPLPRNCA